VKSSCFCLVSNDGFGICLTDWFWIFVSADMFLELNKFVTADDLKLFMRNSLTGAEFIMEICAEETNADSCEDDDVETVVEAVTLDDDDVVCVLASLPLGAGLSDEDTRGGAVVKVLPLLANGMRSICMGPEPLASPLLFLCSSEPGGFLEDNSGIVVGMRFWGGFWCCGFCKCCFSCCKTLLFGGKLELLLL
jgi:hypothetical protein